MDFEAGDQERMIRDAVAKLTERYGRAWFLGQIGHPDGTAALWRELGKAGFLGTLVPEANGGAGLGMAEMAVLLESLAGRGVPLLFLVISAVMGTLAVVKHGSEEQKARFLPTLVSGEKR